MGIRRISPAKLVEDIYKRGRSYREFVGLRGRNAKDGPDAAMGIGQQAQQSRAATSRGSASAQLRQQHEGRLADRARLTASEFRCNAKRQEAVLGGDHGTRFLCRAAAQQAPIRSRPSLPQRKADLAAYKANSDVE